MISVLAIGIENSGSNYNKIDCAFKDSKNVYKTLELVLGSKFKNYCSACLKNISTFEFKCILPALQITVERDDIFVLYFSGHGIQEADGRLKLVFADGSDEYSRGNIEFSQIVSMLNGFKGKVVVILDCCHSGAGVCEINKNNVYCEKNVSILTSNCASQFARFEEGGSIFTGNFCDAVMKLYHSNESITLNNIKNIISERIKNKSCISIGGGEADVVFDEKLEVSEYDLDKLLMKIIASNYDIRETIWFSIDTFSDSMKYSIILKSKGKYKFLLHDPSWRARRALGSVVSSIYGSDIREKIIDDLVNSSDWTSRCIGYIAARKRPSTKVVFSMKKEIQDTQKPMDIVWLAALYLSDNMDKTNSAERIIFKSNLKESIWGAIEIWKHFFKGYDTYKKLALFKAELNKTNYNDLCLHLYLLDELVNINISDYDPLISQYMTHIKKLYKARHRGSVSVNSSRKWIWSMIYGNWRDQVDIHKEMQEILESLKLSEYSDFFKALQYIPSVEVKMAVFDYCVMADVGNESIESLKWALDEEHPWTIRTALKLLKSKFDGRDYYFDHSIFPGTIDLELEIHKLGIEDMRIHYGEELSKIEKESLEWALKNE